MALELTESPFSKFFSLFDNSETGTAELGLNGLVYANNTAKTPSITESIDSLGKSLSLDANLLNGSIYSPQPAKDTTSAVNTTNSILGDYLGGLKEKAGKQQFIGAVLKTTAAAEQVFNSVLTWDDQRSAIKKQAENTKLSAQNKMTALDNQVMYAKNQLMDRFNTLVAHNTAVTAAKGLKVSASSILEQSKETAHDINMDFRTLESNAELQKINLRTEKEIADLTQKFQSDMQVSNLVGGISNLAFAVATGGGTGESWGDLWDAYNGKGTSLNATVYGGK